MVMVEGDEGLAEVWKQLLQGVHEQVSSPPEYFENSTGYIVYGGSLQSSKPCKAIRKPRFREVRAT